jgi:polar amino acid transport system substrate-binding protein
MRTPTVRILAVVAACLLVAAGCSDDDDGDTETSGTTTGESGSFELVSDGTLTICSDIPYTPFEFYTEDSPDELTGFDVEIVDAMATSLDLETEWVTTPFDGIIPSLVAGNCDMIASAMTITEERAEQVAFTDGYFDSEQSLLVRAADEATYDSLESLAGRTIGVQSGTTGETFAEENLPEGATVKAFEGGEELFTALSTNDIDAALQDFPVNFVAAQDDPELVITATFPTDEQYGFALTMENTTLLESLNSALAELRSSGQYDEIYETWFSSES